MREWRRWIAVGLAVVALGGGAVLAAGPTTAASPSAAPAPLPALPSWDDTKAIKPFVTDCAVEVKKARTAARAAEVRVYMERALLPTTAGSTATPTAMWRDEFATQVAEQFKDVVKDKAAKDFVVLNAVILVARLNSFECDSVLEDALLKNDNAGARYWAAKGLAGVFPVLKPIPNAAKQAADAIQAALKEKQDPLVEAALLEAARVAELEVGAKAVELLQIAAASAEKTPPSATDLELAGKTADTLAAALAGGAKLDAAQETAAAQAASNLMSFAAQHVAALSDKATESQVQAAYGLALRAVKLVKVLAQGKDVELKRLPAHPIAADVLGVVNEVTGSQADPGKIPAAFPGVKVPARLK